MIVPSNFDKHFLITSYKVKNELKREFCQIYICVTGFKVNNESSRELC